MFFSQAVYSYMYLLQSRLSCWLLVGRQVANRWEEAYWILETKERGGRSREWRVVERMGGSVLDPRDKGERRKIKGVESS